MPFDLILRGGRVIDPSQKLDAVTDVAFAGGKVAAVGSGLKADPGTDVRDVSGYIVTPGPDRSAHPCLLGRHLARHRRRGILPHLRRHHRGRHRQRRAGQFRRLPQACDRAEPGAHPRLSARLHAGIFGFSHRIMVGESEELRLMDPIEAAEVADANRDLIVGIKVRVGLHASGTSGIVPLDIALEVAERGRHAADGAYRPSAAELRGGAGAPASGRRADPCVPAVSQRARDRAGHGEAGGAGGARARRAVRHRPRQGLVRLQDRARDARQRLLSGHHLLRHPCRSASTARPSTR